MPLRMVKSAAAFSRGVDTPQWYCAGQGLIMTSDQFGNGKRSCETNSSYSSDGQMTSGGPEALPQNIKPAFTFACGVLPPISHSLKISSPTMPPRFFSPDAGRGRGRGGGRGSERGGRGRGGERGGSGGSDRGDSRGRGNWGGRGRGGPRGGADRGGFRGGGGRGRGRGAGGAVEAGGLPLPDIPQLSAGRTGPLPADHIQAIGVKRQQYGNAGRFIKLRSNHIEVELKPGMVYHYDGMYVVLLRGQVTHESFDTVTI